ncbi:universal stress protein, partial [Enterobacter ludwigii]
RCHRQNMKTSIINGSEVSRLSVAIHDIVKLFKLPELKVQVHVVSGSPKDQILRLAETIEADLIIIASHRPDISTYLLGSNAAAVVRHAKCPVLVVR